MCNTIWTPWGKILVNLLLIELVRISGFSFLFSGIAMFLHSLAKCAENTAIAEKREENPEILTNLMRKRLTRKGGVYKCYETADVLKGPMLKGPKPPNN